MTVRQAEVAPRIEVKARITADLHRRLVKECGYCGCHINGFLTLAIAHEIARRQRDRKDKADTYLSEMEQLVLGEANA